MMQEFPSGSLIFSSLCFFSKIPVREPLIIPAKKAAIGLMTANKGPSREYVARMESTPEVGVEERNDTVEPFPAPSFRR